VATDLREQKQNDLDVSEHRRVDEALRASEARFRSVLENSRDVIYRVNVQTGHYDYISPSAETVVGFSPDELAAMDVETAQAMIHPDDAPAMRAGVARLETTGTADVEYRQRAKNGDYRWLSNHMFLVKDSSGRPLYRSGNIRDITEQKQAECALRQSEAQHRALFDNSIDAIFATAPDGRVFAANRVACQTFGMTEEELIRAGREGITDWSDPRHGPALAERARSGHLRRELGYVRKDGTKFTAEISSVILPDRATSFVILRDITERKQAEEELRKGEERHRLLADTMLQGVVHQDGQGSIISMNFAAERILGKTREEFLGSSSVQEEHHSIREDGSPFPGLEHPSMVALRTGKSIRNVVMGVFNPRESAYRWISIDAVPLFRPGDESPYEVYTVFADITERRQAEEALRAGSTLLNSVLDSSLSGIMAFRSIRDAQGRITDFEWQLCNATAERMVGRRATDLVGRKLLVEMPGNKADGLFDKYVVVVETGGPLHHEHYYEHEGLKTWFDTCAVQLGDGFAVTFSDITVRKRAEEALERSKQRLAEVLDSIQDDFYVLDRDWKFVFASRQFTSRIGKQPEDFLGHKIWEMFPKHLGTVYEENLRAVMDKRETRRFETGGKYAEAWYRMTASPSTEGITVLGTEITENKRIEEALREADRRKNEFLAVLSHELRNPLAPIRNSTYILEHCEPGGDQAKRALEVIDRQAAQLAHLVDDLLDVTRITRNKIQLQRHTLELNELVRHTVEDHRTLFDRADVRVEFHPTSRPMSVSADRNRLVQVIGNLLQNAAKFTGRDGETRITISADATERRAVIQVADTGVGMTPELVARLFQPFSQADSTLDRSKGGLGLGLALAKGLVELHGGNITARSAGLGQGAEFVVRLPLAMDDAVAPQAGASASKGRRRVLIIEDNVDAADSLRDVLGFGEHDVEVAYNGPQGIAKAKEFRPDVVFCDIGLPSMDGFEVARAFRADEALKGVFLVALSGYALPEDVARAQAAGFDRHLAKPTSLEKLEEVLESRPGS
jgi:PAS domain S-box-containing protein